MSRPIKFRAWDNGKMNYEPDTYVSDTGSINDAVLNYHNAGTPLMQFTGLHDKNGVEIYEGDILRTDESYPVWVVVYEAPKFVVTTPQTKTSCALYGDLAHEVIGNVHQNPELLERTDK